MADSKDSLPDEEVEFPTFEDSFIRLNEMAEQLEAGGLTLAEATARFEEGMQLVQFCNDMLNNAELRITELKETYNTALAQAFDEGNVEDFDE
jgi:exodeoxyribonuclease VII small subunit